MTETKGTGREKSSLGRRVAAAVGLGFVLVFAFALIMQLTAEFVSWVTNTRISFLFPMGIAHAFTDTAYLASVILGLSLTALVIALILFWRMTQIEARSRIWDERLADMERRQDADGR